MVLQIAALLHPLHGRPDGSQRPGPDGWTPSAGSPPAGRQKKLGWKRRSPAQAPQARSSRQRISGQRGHDDDATPDGSIDPESRTIHPAATQAGLLRYVCPRPTRGHSSTPEGPGPDLEGAGPEAHGRPEVAEPEDAPGGGRSGGTASSDPAARRVKARRPIMGPGSGKRYSDAGWQLAVSTVGPRLEAVETSGTTTPQHAAAAEEPSVAERPASVEQPRPEIPQSEDVADNSALVTPDLTSGLRHLVSLPGAVSEHSLVPPRDVIQGSQHGSLETSTSAAGHREQPGTTILQGEGERQELHEEPPPELNFQGRQRLRQMLLDLKLNNTGTTCYANSAFLAYVWSCMSRKNFQYLDWGARLAALQTILHGNADNLISLEDFDWFSTLLQGWNEHQGQADCAEFGHRLANWLDVAALSNKWERRVTTAASTLTHDHGDKFMPLTLQLDPAMISDNAVSLTALLRLWSTELGMSAGLTDPKDLLVLHVDRMVMTPTGTLYKHEAAITFAWEIPVPVLTTTTDLRYDMYTIVAVTAHLGHANGGHYQTMLRTYPEVSDLAAPSMWMHCDDCRVPMRCWEFPDNFSQGITGIWLCRTDALEMHLMSQPRPTMDMDLLNVLQSQQSLTTKHEDDPS